MTYLLMAIAGLWMADGVALLLAPGRMVALLKEALLIAPAMTSWSGVTVVLGMVLLVGTVKLPYQPLWWGVGIVMIGKGVFLIMAPNRWRQAVLRWCLTRDPLDYRFLGLGLCALALLLLDAVNWGHG